MRAAFYKRFGAAGEVLQIGERDGPAPGAGEVQVRLHTSGINPSDVKKRAGQRGVFPGDFVIPHSDGAGVIVEVGDGVPNSRIGERVWVYESQHNRLLGTAAETISLPAVQAVKMPDNVSFAEGAAVGIPMMTAHRCLTSGGDIHGKTVLVTGGLGRVGFYAVQMAKHFNARVIATVSDLGDAPSLTDVGVDLVVDHNDDDYAGQIVEFIGGANLDLVVDVEFGWNFKNYLPIVRDNGVVASYASSREMNPVLPFYDFMFKNVFIHPILVYSMPAEAKARAIEDITDLLGAGNIVHRIGAEYPLEQIVEAHELLEQGKLRGALVLTIPEG